jgi:hypothetical protein
VEALVADVSFLSTPSLGSPPSTTEHKVRSNEVRGKVPEETEICWTCDSIPTEDFRSLSVGAAVAAAVVDPLVPVDVNLGAESDLRSEEKDEASSEKIFVAVPSLRRTLSGWLRIIWEGLRFSGHLCLVSPLALLTLTGGCCARRFGIIVCGLFLFLICLRFKGMEIRMFRCFNCVSSLSGLVDQHGSKRTSCELRGGGKERPDKLSKEGVHLRSMTRIIGSSPLRPTRVHSNDLF